MVPWHSKKYLFAFILIFQSALLKSFGLTTPLYDLSKDLLTGYDKNIRPVRDPNKAIDVQLYTFLYELISVHEATNVVVISGLIEMYWTDELLTWEPSKYGNVTEIYISAATLWIPDLALYNSSSSKLSSSGVFGDVELNYKGKVEYKMPFIFNVLCQIETRYFPWDKQTCVFTYGPSNRYSTEYRLSSKFSVVDMNFTLSNQEWQVLNMTIETILGRVPDAPDDIFTVIEFKIVIERYPEFFIYVLVVPSALVVFISIIAFFSPYNSKGERQEKAKLGLSSFTFMAVLHMTIAGSLPKASGVIPIIGVYFTSQLILLALGILTATTIMNMEIHARTVPGCLKWTLKMADYLPYTKTIRPKKDNITVSEILHNAVDAQLRAKSAKIINNASSSLYRPDTESKSSTPQNLGETKQFQETLQKLTPDWSLFVSMVKNNMEKQQNTADWQTFVNVLEKMSMLIFLIIWSIFLLLLFFHSWY